MGLMPSLSALRAPSPFVVADERRASGPKTGAQNHDVVAEQPFPSTAIPGRRERQLAWVVVLVSSAVFIAAVPFARQPLDPVWAFIPVYESALAVNDLITAVLLFAQFSISRSRALLVIACGYLFTAAMVVEPTRSPFPDCFRLPGCSVQASKAPPGSTCFGTAASRSQSSLMRR